ncbi:hypothetical protein DVJ83_07730 [Deinococcus wulumuqiensis]|uniref:Uncharacterized protein n=1 Tax=Deinococcus wulumuqiensis TaxID=980427 RepID=A0A345IH95_9DEIO|nr:hypothetical protein DVJ83_07730 [Deinococcus wulumuqiensis]
MAKLWPLAKLWRGPVLYGFRLIPAQSGKRRLCIHIAESPRVRRQMSVQPRPKPCCGGPFARRCGKRSEVKSIRRGGTSTR